MKTKLFISKPKKVYPPIIYRTLYTALNQEGEEILNKAKTENEVFDMVLKKKIPFKSVIKTKLID